MKKLIRRLSRVSHSLLRSDPCPRSDVPAGHLPVYVGEERFVVNADLLRHPIFLDLLDRSTEEYGYHQSGVLRIPINPSLFHRFLHSLRRGLPLSSLDDVVRSASPPTVRVR